MKIEPMSVEGVRNRIKVCYKCSCFTCEKEATAWLTWIHAEAQRRRHKFLADFYENTLDGDTKLEDEWRQYLDDDEWLLEVKREVGWPEGE